MAKDKRSPLKMKPLRQPGQSLDEMIQDRWDDMATYFMFIVGFSGLLTYEWIRWFSDKPPHPILATVIFLIVTGISAYKIIAIKKDVNRLKMARDGERIVGETLDELKRKGVRVLHDIVGDGFNVDHVVIAKQGVFVIDTKTYSKPARGQATIKVDGDRVLVNGVEIERNPITQAKALSKWIRDLLVESTGKKFPVRPVILFPGWFVEPMKGSKEVWVLNPGALEKFIEHETKQLSEEDKQLITYHLSQYIRSKV